MTTSRNRDREHLKLLSTLHYVLGGLMAAFSMIPLIHVGFGIFFITSPETFPDPDGTVPPAFMGWLFVIVGIIVIFVGMALAVCIITSGRFLSKRKGYWFSFVVACIQCINAPLGTALGVFTILVLSRASVKELYGISRPSDSSRSSAG